MKNKRASPLRWAMPASQGFRGRPAGSDLKRGGVVIGRVRVAHTGPGALHPRSVYGKPDGPVWYWTARRAGENYSTLWMTKGIPNHFKTEEAAKASCLAYVRWNAVGSR